MTSVFLTSPSGACHNYLDMEVAAVDTHARVRHGHGLGMDMYQTYIIIALNYMMKSQSASW